MNDTWNLGARTLRSPHLYQLLAYLRNRQAAEPDGPHHEGVLLYPVVAEPLAVEVRLLRHVARYFYRARDPNRIGVAVGAFADQDFPPPVPSVFDESKQKWITFGADVPGFTRGRDSERTR